MSSITLYGYRQCSTCRKAQQWLAARGLEPAMRPIRDQPPTAAELKRVLKALGGQRKRLLNTSSASYRNWPLKERLGELSDDELIAALRADGNLIKRPVLLTATGATTGFKEDEWATLLEAEA
mgnify:CR=1 FL=1